MTSVIINDEVEIKDVLFKEINNKQSLLFSSNGDFYHFSIDQKEFANPNIKSDLVESYYQRYTLTGKENNDVTVVSVNLKDLFQNRKISSIGDTKDRRLISQNEKKKILEAQTITLLNMFPSNKQSMT